MLIIKDIAKWFFVHLRTRSVSLLIFLLLGLLFYTATKVWPLDTISWNPDNLTFQKKIIIAAVLFVWSCILFTTFAPLGSVTVIIAGVFLGIAAGIIQFASQIVSSIFLYKVMPETKESHRIESFTDNSRLISLFKKVEDHPIVFVSLLRLIPITPSAACIFVYKTMFIGFRDMVLGTLIAGWVRPVLLAYFSHELIKTIL